MDAAAAADDDDHIHIESHDYRSSYSVDDYDDDLEELSKMHKTVFLKRRVNRYVDFFLNLQINILISSQSIYRKIFIWRIITIVKIERNL